MKDALSRTSEKPSRRIYIDIDDVLSETITLLNDLLHQHHERRVPYEELTHFDLGVSFRLNATELDRFLELVHEPTAIEGIDVVEGAVASLGGWLDAGYEINLLTGRPPSTDAATRRWLAKHAMPHSSLGFVDKYGRTHTDTSGPAALSLGDLAEMDFCLAVEDSLEVASYLAGTVGVDVALVDHPWNRNTDHLPRATRARLHRCHSWAEIIERFPAP
ncbi:MAG: putative HAD superfamily protein [Myxococcota bacterium]|jgi:uncharacterized HAD superfamily protein